MTKITSIQVDALLPQTQCKLCSYAGCQPYAQAIVDNNEALDRCLPGGVSTMVALGKLVNQDVTPMIADMQAKQKARTVVSIREELCIGCTKCIAACPVDAIVGSAKRMHTVITDECTGCELCIAPCPMDCIDILPVTDFNETRALHKAEVARTRFQAHQQRMQRTQINAELTTENQAPLAETISDKKSYIASAVLRAKLKRQQLTY